MGTYGMNKYVHLYKWKLSHFFMGNIITCPNHLSRGHDNGCWSEILHVRMRLIIFSIEFHIEHNDKKATNIIIKL